MTATSIDRPPVYFHIPAPDLVKQVPATVEAYTTWVHGAIQTMPARLPSGEPWTLGGPYNWIVQTYIYLRTDGFPCELVSEIPTDGIVIGHSSLLPPHLRPGPRQFIVEVKPDKFLQCTFANFAIVQNRHDTLHTGYRRRFIPSAFVHNWPQPGVIPRDQRRGDRFENVCFMGNPLGEFLREIPELDAEIRRLGLNWVPMPRERWHDYSETDVVLAVRQADSMMFDRKPPTRLVNAWIAGAPAILSPDPAFEEIRTSPLDFLAASNVPQISAQLQRLMAEPGLRKAMVERGRTRVPEFSAEKNVRRWVETIDQQIVPLYRRWTGSWLRRQFFVLSRAAVHRTIGIDPDTRLARP